MWATIPLTIAGTLIILSYLDPLPEDEHNGQWALLDRVYYGAGLLAIVVTFAALVFGVGHSVGPKIDQDSDY